MEVEQIQEEIQTNENNSTIENNENNNTLESEDKKIIISKSGKKYMINPTTGKRYLVYERKGPKKTHFSEEEKQHRLYLAYIKSGIKKLNTDLLSKEEKDELLRMMVGFQVKLL